MLYFKRPHRACENHKHKKAMQDPNNVYWNISRIDMTPKERERFNQEIDGRIVYAMDK